MDTPGLQQAYDAAFDAMLTTLDRRDRLDREIEALAADSMFTPVVTRLGCLRGVSTLTAFGLAAEIGDWGRLTGRSIGAYLGLVPTEYSSGSTRVQGGVTKTGNGHARRLLIEAAWHHRARYRPGQDLRRRWDAASPAGLHLGDDLLAIPATRPAAIGRLDRACGRSLRPRRSSSAASHVRAPGI